MLRRILLYDINLYKDLFGDVEIDTIIPSLTITGEEAKILQENGHITLDRNVWQDIDMNIGYNQVIIFKNFKLYEYYDLIKYDENGKFGFSIDVANTNDDDLFELCYNRKGSLFDNICRNEKCSISFVL